MNVLIACEMSGVVRRAFRDAGHTAWSCDILPAEDGSPYHHQGDVRQILNEENAWDLVIAHPPCDYLTISNNGPMTHGCSLYTADEAKVLRANAIDFFMAMVNAPAARVCVENPVGVMSKQYRKPDQYVQPWEYGHPESKKTGLWLKNLPKLVPTNVLPLPACGHWDNQTPSGQNKLGPSADRKKLRSNTYEGIARAMAAQWGVLK